VDVTFRRLAWPFEFKRIADRWLIAAVSARSSRRFNGPRSLGPILALGASMMPRSAILTVGLSLAMTSGQGCAAQGQTLVTLHDARGTAIGTATLEPSATSGLTIGLDLKGLPPGEHAVHLHQVAKCEGPKFESAGPHLNLSGRQHGLENPLGPHTGDMSNVTVGTDGATLANTRLTLGPGEGSLVAIGGAAIVIHAQRDDMRTDPAGNAGDRIACGVIVPR
jgi:Cu-Zn family superoxide dismutase